MASSFFNPQSKATRFLTALANLILVNFIFIITSIPVFTLGASVTALYRITIAIIAGDNPSVIKDYWKSFKENFLKATGLFLFYCATTAFFLFEIYMVRTMMDPEYGWSSYPAYFFLCLIAASSFYAFPLLAWFHESFPQLLKNSILIAITNLPITIMYIVISAGLAYVCYQFPTITLSIMIFIGISGLAVFYSVFLKRIFKKLGAEISFSEKDN